mmetsp:Transcript_17208/g.24324  ORF Transcript_17208/g.24324 Transcript_17208/m.24324 type:complete len:81 (+) Transcript_17208:504-746(+)
MAKKKQNAKHIATKKKIVAARISTSDKESIKSPMEPETPTKINDEVMDIDREDSQVPPSLSTSDLLTPPQLASSLKSNNI